MIRCSNLIVAAVLACVASAAFAQARAQGTVRDTAGKPIRSATITATNPEAFPAQFTATSDSKGRWAMIGLRPGNWKFTVEAPGFLKMEASAPMRVAGGPPLNATLGRDPGPVPNALEQGIQKQLLAANALRDDGRFDQALAAYQDIKTRNPKFTSVGLAIGGTYRVQASKTTDPAARKALLDRAIESYSDVLKADPESERARLELDAARTDAAR